ncbi:MAG: ribosomal protection-like ABC-F family protein [Chloroflexota bacterium]
MSLITATDLSKYYGAQEVFMGISLSIPVGARIALVGPNGVGKTTLFRILVGEEQPSEGVLQRARNLRIGYLPQNGHFTTQQTLWEVCLDTFGRLISMQVNLAKLEAAMGDSIQAETALERYGPLQEEFERLGGYTYEAHMRQVLSGLGFTPRQYNRPITQLSNGQRTRALLARLLLEDNNLLVLDEPTNHLDIQAIEWLEGYLNQWEGTVLLVMHDRYFLDKVAHTIWELGPFGLESYRGNYSDYAQQREIKWERRQDIFAAEKTRMEKDLDYIRRNIAGQNTNQARGRLRRLSRQIEAVEKGGFQALKSKSWARTAEELEVAGRVLRVEEATQRLRALHLPDPRPQRLKLRLEAKMRSGDIVLRTRNLVVGYPDEGRSLFAAPDLILRRGECVAVIGPNGAGKTTFLKTILNQVSPLGGEVILGASLHIGYLDQTNANLHPNRSLLEEIQEAAPHLLVSQVRDYLARYLFTGDDVFKVVSYLSGGERSRLALAKLALTKANLLLLDEPTNHLDLPSQEVLQSVLADYPETIIMVSHDRYLIDVLATQIWEIDADEASLDVFVGTYSESRAQTESPGASEGFELADRTPAEEASSAESRRSSAPLNPYQRKVRLAELEAEIGSLEGELSALGEKLSKPPHHPDDVRELGERYQQARTKLDSLIAEWDKLSQE